MTDPWVIEEDGFDVARANYFETLFTVGNGRTGTRGSLEEGHLGALSGFFLNGVYDGHGVAVIDLVNARRVARVIDGLEQQVVVVTHQLDLLDGFDRVLVVDGGRVVEDAAPRPAIAAYRALMERR